MLKKYLSANDYFRSRFGCKVYKLALACSDTCPNRDGRAGSGGCIFCGNGSGEFAEKCLNAAELDNAIAKAKLRISAKTNAAKFIAYFQSYTSTYAPIDRLDELFHAAARREDIAALSVATRPDCLPDDVMRLLASVASEKPLFVELGLQTTNENTAKLINRGFTTDLYDDAVKKLHGISAKVIAHMILGLPGEDRDTAVATAKHIGQTADGIKLQLMFVIEGTALADMYKRGEYLPLGIDEYADMLCACMDALPADIVIHRLTGDPPKRLLLAPAWAADKKRVLNFINEKLRQHGICRAK